TALIEGLDRVSAAIVERDDELRDLLEQAEALSGTLAEKDQTLVQLVDASEQILTLIANRRDELAAALGEGADAVVQLGRLIGEHRTELDRILDNLHPTLDVVAAHQDDLDVGLAWAGPAFYQQALAGSHGPWLDIFVYSLGVDPQSLLCGLFNQLGVSSECPP
ncbi:MAG: MCE family protein, partial [Chloroflexi bacterium]|nr:MCE family protein [Chloroflexota bacterium]